MLLVKNPTTVFHRTCLASRLTRVNPRQLQRPISTKPDERLWATLEPQSRSLSLIKTQGIATLPAQSTKNDRGLNEFLSEESSTFTHVTNAPKALRGGKRPRSLQDLSLHERYQDVQEEILKLLVVKQESPNSAIYQALLSANTDCWYGSASEVAFLLRDMIQQNVAPNSQALHAALRVSPYVLQNATIIVLI